MDDAYQDGTGRWIFPRSPVESVWDKWLRRRDLSIEQVRAQRELETELEEEADDDR